MVVLLFAHQCKSTKIRSTCPRNKFWCEIGLGIPWIPTKVPMSSKVHMGNIRRGNWVSPTTDWSLLLLWNWGIPSRFCIHQIIKFFIENLIFAKSNQNHTISSICFQIFSGIFNQADNTKTLCKNVFNLQFVISVAMTPSLIPRILLAIVWLNDVHQSCWQQQQICYSPSSLQKVPISPLLWLFKRDRIWGAKFFIAPLLYRRRASLVRRWLTFTFKMWLS